LQHIVVSRSFSNSQRASLAVKNRKPRIDTTVGVYALANMHGPRQGIHTRRTHEEKVHRTRAVRTREHWGGRVVFPRGHPGRSRLTSDLGASVFP